MINFKEKELVNDFFKTAKKKFPEIELVNITRSPDDANHIWINVSVPNNEDRLIELTEFSSEKGHEILLDYGYWISIIPDKNHIEQCAER